MNLYEDQSIEPKFEDLSDQIGLFLLDLLLVGLQKARTQTQIFQKFAQAKAEAANPPNPF